MDLPSLTLMPMSTLHRQVATVVYHLVSGPIDNSGQAMFYIRSFCMHVLLEIHQN